MWGFVGPVRAVAAINSAFVSSSMIIVAAAAHPPGRVLL
jgi:hypothetical protein